MTAVYASEVRAARFAHTSGIASQLTPAPLCLFAVVVADATLPDCPLIYASEG